MKVLNILTNIKRMILLCWKHNKKYLFFSGLQVMASSVKPFIAMIFMKYFIDSLSDMIDLIYTIKIVFIMITLRIIFETIETSASGFVKLYAKGMMVPMAALFCRQSVEMDYENTLNPEVLEEINRASTVLLNGDNLEEYMEALNGIIIAVIQIAGTIGIITTFNPIVFAVVFIVSVIITGIQILFQRKNYDLYHKGLSIDRKWRYFLDLAVNTIYGKMVRVYDLKDFILSRSKGNREDFFQNLKKILKNDMISSLICLILDIVQMIIILTGLVFSVISNRITIGSFSLLLSSSQQFSNSLLLLSSKLISLYKSNNYICDFFDFINRPNRLRNNVTRGLTVPEEPAEIEFRNVYFKYPNSEYYVIKNLNLRIPSGQHLMIVGENGSGKTTLVKLLLRLYDVTEGEILYNGVNIKKYDYDNYLRMFGTVFTDYKIFALSVYENIVFKTNYESLKPKVDAILEQTGLSEKIKSLPYQGETNLSRLFENQGMYLSGGQMHKLAFSRSIYRNGVIQILDEPTANLSPLAESEIYEQFEHLLKGKTSFFISHRFSSSKISDKICVLENGSIVEYGTHKELINKKGIYAEMYQIQAQYYDDKETKL
ncbi:ABC transporter ATP-binding protein [Hungatella hathewayi]|uniref:ABC transporter ATP-binding protein n=1 Tax=Hungatella hathewayi TaxID=154046 RepID=UPI003561A122